MTGLTVGTAPVTAIYVPQSGYEAEINFAAKSVGAMPTVMDTGQAIVKTYNTSVAADPVISNPGAGSRYTIAATAASAQAGYVTVQLAGNVTKLSVDFVYQVGVHAWRDPFPAGLLTLSTEGSVCHLGFATTGWTYSIWDAFSGLATVSTRTYSVARSSTAAQHGEVIIDKAAGKAYVTGDDGTQVTLTDARISAYNCPYAQCEIYYNNAATEPRTSVSKFQATSAAGGAGGGFVSASKVYIGSTKVWPSLPVTYIGASHANSNIVAAPAGQLTNDLLIVVAWQTSATAPTLPAGWTNWPGSPTANNGSTAAYRVGYKYAASSSETSGTWAGAGSTMMFVWRNSAPGAIASNTGNSNSIGFPALTLQSATGSYGLRTGWHTGASDVYSGTITGYTNRATGHNQLTGKTSTAALTGNPTLTTQGVNAANTWLANTIEVKPA